jgi:hypothetical protein
MADPLTPPGCDLRDYPYLGIDIARLFDSEFHAKATDAEWRAGVTLWLKSFHQVPAASLPDDDASLARLAEFARDVKSWRKVKDMALYGWQKASDGRLYHPVVAGKALEGWVEKLRQRKSSAAGNAKRYDTEYDPQPFDDAISAAVVMLATLSPHSRLLRSRAPTGTPTGNSEVIPPGSQEKGREDKERKVEAATPVNPNLTTEESNFVVVDFKKDGTGRDYEPGTVTIENPLERVSIFQRKLSAFMGHKGYEVVTASMNLDDPTRDYAYGICKENALKMGAKGMPIEWPRLHLGNPKNAHDVLKAAAEKMRARNSKPVARRLGAASLETTRSST